MGKSTMSMRLFGAPFQYNATTDPRVSSINSQIGKRYLETVYSEPPILTLIPGKPKYLPGKGADYKKTAGYLMLNASDTGDTSNFTSFINGANDKNKISNFRLYDFEKDYIGYMRYVNILCRTGAAFLGLNNSIQVGTGSPTPLTKFDWSRYHLKNTDPGGGGVTTNFVKWVINKTSKNSDQFKLGSDGTDSGSLESIFETSQYVQFYVDPESSSGSDGLSNSTSESQLKSLFDSASGWAKELGFLMNSGGINATKYQNFVSGSATALGDFINQTIGGTGSGAIARILNIGGNVLKGDNIIIPEIYQSTEREGSHSVTIHLRSPYGSTFAYYMNIFVPLMHLMALVMPKQTSSNSYNSPFIVKAYMEGSWTSNLAIVRSISIQRAPESRSMDGLANEVDVTLDIQDLYSDLSMTPGDISGAASQFIHNASLIDFIATNCGMSLTQPNIRKKWDATWGNISAAFNDILPTMGQSANEGITKLAESILKAAGLGQFL